MNRIFLNKRKWFFFGLSLALFGFLALQAPALSYSMESMDCGGKIMCAACGVVVNAVSPPLSSFFTELTPLPKPLTPKPIFLHEPQIHPPQ